MDLSAPADSKQSPSVKSKNTPAVCSQSTGPTSPATTMCEPSQQPVLLPMELPLMSLQEDFPAKTYRLQDYERDLKASAAGYGKNTPDLLASYDPSSSSWKTWQTCVVEGLETYSVRWPRSGMTRNGIAYQLAALAPTTFEIASGSLPTSTAQGLKSLNSAGGSNARRKWAKMLPKIMPTQTAHDYRGGCLPERSERMREQSARGLDLPSVLRLLFPDSTGLVRPSWAEARMGFPIGWTECTPLATPSSRKSSS